MLHHPNISPVLLDLGFFELRWYPVMYILSFVLGYMFMPKMLKKNGLNVAKDDFEKLMFSIMLGVILGGRIGYVLFYNFDYYLQNPLEIILPFTFKGGFKFTGIAGLSFHGGALGVILASLLWCKKRKINFYKLADPTMPLVALGLGLGRLGNFINSELYGRITASPLGMVFKNAEPVNINSEQAQTVLQKLNLSAGELAPLLSQNGTLVNLPRHASQLYEFLFEGLVMFFVLYFLFNKKLKSGTVFWSFIGLYGLFRFFIEFFRQPDAHLGLFFGYFSMGQILCTAMMLTTAAFLVFIKPKPNQL